ncbi:GNAT family N-acetyltransferase [Microbulbifer sp. YPW1]|uniref:GNAT family N-acetyltransferase n=1 Tax=Microbulbifer sp. YPW1 TaxID=2745199 RepID=UPI00159944E7|nr:GNAT family N-acetyltransferase [Microbulbifer sp. YPW1]QKX18498.1 GNAT family N-acetyltransferase [Microbulbifer sp. YPW1]
MPNPTPNHQYCWSTFDELTTCQLHEILQARQEVFVVEQDCAYQDVDGKDPVAWHLACWDGHADTPSLLAYLRVVMPGRKYTEPSIGRVLTRKHVRGAGVGRELMRLGIEYTLCELPRASIRISAQLYLKRFYEELGFVQTSEPYDEDGIPHIEMLRTESE